MNERFKDQREGGFLIAKIHQLSNRLFNKLLKEKGLDNFNSAQGRIMFVLWREDNISLMKLSKRTQLSKTTLSSMLRNLEKEPRGFIKRVPSERDQREVLIQLTEKGRKIQNQYITVSKDMTELFYRPFSEEEIDTFELFLKRLLDNLINYQKKKS